METVYRIVQKYNKQNIWCGAQQIQVGKKKKKQFLNSRMNLGINSSPECDESRVYLKVAKIFLFSQ